jgi:hypothetical protein
MNTQHEKSGSPDRKHVLRLVAGNAPAAIRESAELHRLLEQVRKALIRLESELTRLEVVLQAVNRKAGQDEQERIQ